MATGKSPLDDMQKLYAALADKTRLRLLNLIREDEICVCFFTEVLNESQPKISRHLAYLRKSGLVTARREGKWMHYRLVEPECPLAAAVLRSTLDWLGEQDTLKSEFDELVAVCCSKDVPDTIAKAPKPEALVDQDEPQEVEYAEDMETYLL